MRFLHCSDIHLGRRPAGARGLFTDKRYKDYFTAFDYVIEVALERKVEAMIITGDMFDKKELHPDSLIQTETALQRLKDSGIPVLLIEGNHDNIYSDREEESWIIYLEKRGLIQRPYAKLQENGWTFKSICIEDVNFYGLGYPGSAGAIIINELSERLNPEEKNVVLIHTAVSQGRNSFMGTIEKDIIDKLKGKVIYAGGGHLHYYHVYPKDNPFFYVPGAPEYFNMDDSLEGKGMIIFDTDTKEHEFIESRKRNKIHIEIQLDIESDFNVEEKALEEIQDYKFEQGEDIVILNIRLSKDVFFNKDLIEQELLNKGALKAIVNIKRPSNVGVSIDKKNSAVSEIEIDIIKNWEVFSSDPDAAVKRLDNLKSLLRENKEEDFIAAFDELISKFAIVEEQNDN